MNGFIEWCQYNALSQFMRSAKWPYPSVEILHIAGLILVFGSMLILNLRIFGRILRREPPPPSRRRPFADHLRRNRRSIRHRPRALHDFSHEVC